MTVTSFDATAGPPDFAPPAGAPVVSASAPVPAVSATLPAGALPAPGTPSASVKPFARGTLSRRLAMRVTALTALVALALSLLTAFATYTILEGQLDQQLLAKANASDLGDRSHHLPASTDLRNAGGPGGGQTIGQLQYVQVTDDGWVQNGTSAPVILSTQARTTLAALPAGKDAVTVEVPGMGLYRVSITSAQVLETDTGVTSTTTIVTGLPMSQVLVPMGYLLLTSLALTVAAIAAAYLVARKVVQSSLRPLKRLAATATQVARLELDSGEVEMPVRVPDADIDPRSEVGQVGLAFNHMLDNVEGALASRHRSEMKVRQFVADASHELRNPLASIRGYAELTRRERDDAPPDTAHALGRIESESARMSSLVEDLLLLARLDSGPNLALTATRLNELVANAVSDAQVAGPDHEWELSLPEREVVAVGDPFRLLQVIANLLANARTHTPAGTLVSTSLSTEGTFAVIKVADNGPGIPESIRDKVFERFTRADASRVRSGKGQSTGLGLAIVSAVVGAHRGTASVESSERGTTFTVRIPLARS
jgi:two-component system, OmpR family, sensor kinase